MASNTMNFGPEWMRRFPKSNQSNTDQSAKASSPPASPLQDWNQSTPATTSTAAMPVFSYSSIAASNVRSQNGSSSQSSALEATVLDGASGSNSGANTGAFAADSLNPFKYSKELMLSLYRPTGLPIEFERHEYMTSEESLPPMSSLPFSEQEIKLLAGSVNSEVARRTAQPAEGGQERTPGQRRESFSNAGEHSSGRYDRSDKATSHSRNYESRSHGASARPRNLNSEGRSHSFRRTEQIEREREREREPEDDGLWNSPIGNSVGSFDANGVFRIIGDGDELQPLAGLQDSTSKRPSDDIQSISLKTTEEPQPGGNTTSSSRLQDSISEASSAKVDQSSPTPQQQKPQESSADIFFPSSLLSGKGLGTGPVREDAEFAPFDNNQSSNSNPTAISEPPFESGPIELSKWLYRDPSGSIQGPFSSEEMHEWYKGGFFTPDLLVKREHDPTFEPLGSLIRMVGSEDKPFLLAGAIRQEQPVHSATSLRPSIPSLAQTRQPGSQMNLSSGWVGMSAPTTPSTPNFGVDRLLMQQQLQQQQQHSSGDLFSSTSSLNQQRSGLNSTQDPSGNIAGLESRWSSNFFGGRGQNVESGGGWGIDSFSRSSASSMPAVHTPLGGPHYMDQQQRLHSQELERQQYMQLLQRQSQMQAILHQQQFMAAQQLGNDPHALAALLARQQAQQRQLQLRYQQIQFAGLHAQTASTPGGTAIPWGGMGVGMGQPSSPWTTTIIPSSSDNYFDFNKTDGSQTSHPLQAQPQQQQPQQQQQQLPQMQMQQQQFQPFQQDSLQQPLHQQHHDNLAVSNDHPISQDGLPSQHDSAAAQSLAERLESLEIHDNNKKEQQLVESAVEEKQSIETSNAAAEQIDVEEKEMDNHVVKPVKEVMKEEEPEPVATVEPEQEQWHHQADQEEERQDQEYAEDNSSEATSFSTGTESTHRITKASPAPWAKPINADDDAPERRGPTLREIQEMEAKKAEEAKAERQAQLSTVTTTGSNVLDFTKGMLGAPAWSSGATNTPKKKTLKEIQQEEEAALKRARAATQQSNVSATPSGNQSTGLAAIIASGTGSIGRRYADTISPKPATVPASAGAWGTVSSGATASKPTLMTRSSAVFASNPSLNSPTHSASRNSDSWIEVGSKHSSNPSSSAAINRAAAPTVSASTSVKPTSSNSNEPRPPSEEFLRWCRQALKDLQNVVLEDFIQMLLTFPLNHDPLTVEIISESIYANSKSMNGRQFADEFIKRRKADAYPNGAPASMNTATTSGTGAGGSSDTSFKVVSKKGKKKGAA